MNKKNILGGSEGGDIGWEFPGTFGIISAATPEFIFCGLLSNNLASSVLRHPKAPMLQCIFSSDQIHWAKDFGCLGPFCFLPRNRLHHE